MERRCAAPNGAGLKKLLVLSLALTAIRPVWDRAMNPMPITG